MSPVWKTWPESKWFDRLRCAMCGFADDRTVRDHCHETGLVRGRLCYSCNQIETSSDAEHWQAWRAWDNPAGASNVVEVYRDHLGETPLHFTSDLSYLTRSEQREWWAEQEAASEAGADWPTPFPAVAAERRAAAWESHRAAIATLDDWLEATS